MEKNKKYKILSLDFWDTIVRRDCHPDEIKVMTAEYICLLYPEELLSSYNTPLKLLKLRLQCERQLGELSLQNNSDDEYELHEVIKMVLTTAFKNSDMINSSIIEELYQYELKMEIAHSHLDEKIIDFINQFFYEKLIVISDFYAGTNFIKTILDTIHFPLKIDCIFISCEHHLNKRSSNLFKYVLEKLNINPTDQLHIGDNVNSDVEIPKTLGINSFHYLPIKEHEKRIFCEQNFDTSDYETIEKYKDFPINITDISVFFAGFTSWLTENCIAKNIQKLYFFTREGEFYKLLFDLYAKNMHYKEKLPQTYILEVSRVATFLPSIRTVTLDEMMRIWNQYSCQSMKAFFKSLRLDSKIAQTYTKKHGIDYEKILTYPWEIPEIQSLFKDIKFIAWIENEIKKNKNLFLEYCKERELTPLEHSKIGIVDIGWRGTIQDNLCYMFPNYQIDGFYIGLVNFLNKQPLNSKKYGYLNSNSRSNILFHTLTPFEMICNSPNGSTISYKRDENKVIALRKKEISEDNIYFAFTQNYQNNILKNLQKIILWEKRHYITSIKYHAAAFNSLYNFCCYPELKCANAYFNLVHNEEFGIGEYINKKTYLHLFLMISAIFSRKKRNEFKTFLINTTWPQGYLRKYHLLPLLRIYNNIVEKHDTKNN